MYLIIANMFARTKHPGLCTVSNSEIELKHISAGDSYCVCHYMIELL